LSAVVGCKTASSAVRLEGHGYLGLHRLSITVCFEPCRQPCTAFVALLVALMRCQSFHLASKNLEQYGTSQTIRNLTKAELGVRKDAFASFASWVSFSGRPCECNLLHIGPSCRSIVSDDICKVVGLGLGLHFELAVLGRVSTAPFSRSRLPR
jgi:hypothetical protein